MQLSGRKDAEVGVVVVVVLPVDATTWKRRLS